MVELLLAMSIVSILAGVSSRVITVGLASWSYSRTQNETIQSACFALDHIVNKARVSNRLILPLGVGSTRDVLAFSAMVDTDADGLIDEDLDADLSMDGAPGILGIDDDGDGSVDEYMKDGQYEDDDEDAFHQIYWRNANEDNVDGYDNEHDGLIDEDTKDDVNSNYKPGIEGKDDDGDGSVDEGGFTMRNDDDEDGRLDEDSVEYWLYYCDPVCDPNGGRLIQRDPNGQTEVLAEGVTTFQVTRRESAISSGIELTLGITDAGEEETILKTAVYLLPEPEFADYAGWP
ncbi:MAG: hypothetical protein JXA79_10935 [Deltaproteobacteria bacterium]|nr:hypothetical protein [Deltaproteobacteria bacterium]